MKPEITLINLFGNEGVGKTTTATWLSAIMQVDYDMVLRYSIADPMRAVICTGHLAQQALKNQLIKEIFRDKLIEVGQSYKEELGANYWIDIFTRQVSWLNLNIRAINREEVLRAVIITDDIRFKQELDGCYQMEGIGVIKDMHNFWLTMPGKRPTDYDQRCYDLPIIWSTLVDKDDVMTYARRPLYPSYPETQVTRSAMLKHQYNFAAGIAATVAGIARAKSVNQGEKEK